MCENPACRFGRGSSLDYLALHLQDYREAIEAAAEIIPFYEDRILEQAHAHKTKRRLTDFAVSAEHQNGSPDNERLMLKTDFSGALNVPASAFNRGHWFLSSEQAVQLTAILLDMDIDIPSNLHDKAVSIAPFWGNLHTLSTLYVLGKSMDSFKICEIAGFRSSWFGLQQMHPAAKKASIFSSYPAAMQAERALATVDRDVFPTTLHVNARSNKEGFLFSNQEFRSEADDWPKYIHGSSHTENFETSMFVVDGFKVPINSLLDQLLNRMDFMAFLDMVGGMRLGTSIKAHLLQLARQMRNRRNGELLESVLSQRLLETDDKGAIYECADGYAVETAGRLSRATNFIVEFKSATSFSALADVLYSGRFFVGPNAYDFEMPGRRMDSTTQFVETLQSIQTLSGNTDPTAPTATVYRPRDWRRVMDVFRIKNSEITRLRGVSVLGWTRKHDQFILPTAVIDAQGMHSGIRYHADEEGEHHCYNSLAAEPPDSIGDMPEIDPYIAEFVSAMLAQTVRYHFGLKVRLWALHNNARTRELAGRLFAGIGQTAPLRLTKIIPRNLELNRGLPCLVAPLSNELQMNKLQVAGAVLADRGSDWSRIRDEDIDIAARILPALLCEVTRRLIQNEHVSFKERRSVMPIGTLAEEGARLIRQDFWPDWPEVGRRWINLDAGMEAVEPVIKEVVVMDAEEIVFRPRFWELPKLDPTDLHLEFGLCCRSVRRTDAGLAVDKLSGQRLLGEFFGELPELLPA